MIVIEKVGNKKFKKTYLKLEDNNSNLKGKEIAYSFTLQSLYKISYKNSYLSLFI